MTACICHDPVVFGHMRCPLRQPRRQVLDALTPDAGLTGTLADVAERLDIRPATALADVITSSPVSPWVHVLQLVTGRQP